MPKVNKILVAICFSEYCTDTFTYAAQLALQLQAELMVANVINVRDVHAISTIESMGYAVSAENYVKAIREERKGQLQNMIADSGFPQEKIKSVFRVGHPLEELIRVVEEEKIDRILVALADIQFMCHPANERTRTFDVCSHAKQHAPDIGMNKY